MVAETSLSIQIDGMSCASCVGHVEDALTSVPGVSTAVVNLATESALVHIGSEYTASPGCAITSALETAGYPAIVDEMVLDVSGMSCASCVGRLEKALQQGQGVVTASVNLANESASVRYLVGATDAAAILELCNKAGYPAVVTIGGGAIGGGAGRGRDSQSARKDIEATKLRRLTLVAAVFALPVFIIEMGSHFIPAMHHFVANTIGLTNSRLFQFVLTTLVLFWPGLDFYRKGFPALFKGRPDMNSLVAVGTTAAYGFSVVATFVPGLLPAGTNNVYYEAAAVIVVLILLGRYLEARAKGRTGQAIKKLIDLQPKTASVERDGVVSSIPIESVLRGDVIHVRPGETLAVDGMVRSGASFVDESMISGEPMAVEKTTGASLIGGTVNGTGALVFTATNVGRDTMLARIIIMVEQAQGAKLPIQSVVDRITAWFVPAVMLVALMTVIIWFVFGPSPQLGFALVAGVAVLIIACPCAMGLATPTSIMVGTGRAAEMGVLFRKGEALQQLQTTAVVALDKTGTLTAGQPALTDFAVTSGFDENEVLRLVAAVEENSEHPVASAIVQAARDKGIQLPATESFDSITGYGVRAKVAGKTVLVGADRLMIREGISLSEFKDSGLRLGEQGKTPLYAAIDSKLAAVIAVADPIKSGTPEAIEALHRLGLRVAMITGDNQSTADAVARELGIDHVVAEVLPEGKVAALEKLRANGDSVTFVGDGINDAPALAVADVGVAIGTGTDIAIEAADVVLMSGDLKGVVNAFDISRKTMRNIHQNLFWAFTYNVLLIPVAAGVLYPWNGMMLSPILAAGAMSLSSVFVISNALRLRWVVPVLR